MNGGLVKIPSQNKLFILINSLKVVESYIVLQTITWRFANNIYSNVKVKQIHPNCGGINLPNDCTVTVLHTSFLFNVRTSMTVRMRMKLSFLGRYDFKKCHKEINKRSS